MLLSLKASPPISTTSPHSVSRGERVSIRRRIGPDMGDLLGWVTHAGTTAWELIDRHGNRHRIDTATILAWRRIPLIPVGRNPEHGDRSILARMLSDLTGAQVHPDQIEVARIADLVTDVGDGLTLVENRTPPVGVVVAGEWCAVSDADEVVTLAAWAALHNARNVAWLSRR